MRGLAAERRLFREIKDACARYELLQAPSRALVAMSGGKDSYTLAEMLMKLSHAKAIRAELVLVHLDQGQPGYDGAPLRAWMKSTGLAYEVLREDTYQVVTDKLAAGATYCSLCSRLRRGILYDAAERLGCKTIVLGHHRDDALETLLMNLFFSGRLSAMPPTYETDDGRFEVVRPLIECSEEVIAQYAEHRAFPILPCNLCGSQPGLQREQMKALLDRLSETHPDVRSVMLHALKNVRPTHLLDTAVRDAWQSQGGEAERAANALIPTASLSRVRAAGNDR